MFEYTDDTISLIQAAIAAGGAVFFIVILLDGLATVIRDTFFGG